MNRALRLAAGTLALALPLAAAAGCGAEKKKTIKQEWSAAQTNLLNSKSASFTLKLDDSKGNLAKLLTKDGDVPDAIATALVKGSISVTVDAPGDATLGSGSTGSKKCLDTSSFGKGSTAFVIRDDKAEVLELRVVDGTLYAHIGLDEISALAKAGGVDDFDAMLDENVGQMSPQLATALKDVRAGKWLKLPLSKYLDQLKGMAQSAVPQNQVCDFSGFGKKALDAVKGYVKVTDANDSSKNRVLDVKVQVKPAINALVQLVKSDKSLPFAGMLGDLDPTDVTKGISDGVATGTITLGDGHLKGFSVDLESIRQLSTHPGSDSLAGVKLDVDVDDSAGSLSAPTDVSSVDLEKVVGDLVGSFFGAGMSQSFDSSQFTAG